ncbi:class I glutamine amidotransferase-like protein [Echria macrotheca]|uniref:Class I glutamine amidotransferase-like protein n=1 Tax=Echria macrotheca TaxID=438768 RepID=A0AAJ0BBV5_9PEZI|nr:class I glutamine amidotransferase-like protein [Echria macrotheca]
MGANDDSTTRPTCHIGVFLPVGSQLLDMACIDIFATMSYEYFSVLGDMAPPPILKLAPSVKISYISTVQPDEFIEMTANLKIRCTHHLSDPEVQPGKLDVVLVPGPDPRSVYDEASLAWLRGHAVYEKVDVLSVCTGIYICGEAGLLKGKRVCGPRGLQKELKARFEGATWAGKEMRWVQDGNFWSCGGVTNGNDLVSAYCRQSRFFSGPVAEFGLALTDTGDRGQRYDKGQTAFTLGIVWQVLKALVLGFGKKKPE